MITKDDSMGRWYIAENDGIICTIRDADDVLDSEKPGMVCENATPEDARLIAAAPDLLASLEEIVILCLYNSPEEKRAKAAIAKATQEGGNA